MTNKLRERYSISGSIMRVIAAGVLMAGAYLTTTMMGTRFEMNIKGKNITYSEGIFNYGGRWLSDGLRMNEMIVEDGDNIYILRDKREETSIKQDNLKRDTLEEVIAEEKVPYREGTEVLYDTERYTIEQAEGGDKNAKRFLETGNKMYNHLRNVIRNNEIMQRLHGKYKEAERMIGEFEKSIERLDKTLEESGKQQKELEERLKESKIILVEPLSTSQRHGGITGLKIF